MREKWWANFSPVVRIPGDEFLESIGMPPLFLKPSGFGKEPNLFVHRFRLSLLVGTMVWKSNCERLGRPASACSLMLLAWMASSVVGCGQSGPEIVPVHGVVTLDGVPVAGKYVSFTPETFEPDTQSGRSSVGITEEDGSYELFYTAGKEGALIGTHIVTIATPPDAEPPQPEIIPEKYRVDTELRAEVEDKNNAIDFKLTSD